MDDARRHADLSPVEARVLGCLIEKESTTPDAYPLTLNGLRTACNQSTSRDPVMSLDDHEVERALATLRERGLTRTVHSTSNRATKYRHVVPDEIGLDDAETALVAVLLLRGEQTVGELKSRTERIHVFESVDAVVETLAGLAARDEPLARQLERRPGQKDARWIELLSVRDQPSTAEPMPTTDSSHGRADSPDPYAAATAEFYDLLATDHWETFGLQLLELLDGVDPSAGPVVDLGAGTGVGLPFLTAAVPGASIHAVEPSRAMRVALHARLATDDGLRSLVTVDPHPFTASRLPGSACALVASAVLGHLADAERGELWAYLAGALPPGAPAVIEVLPPERPVVVPPTRYRERRVGNHVYEGWQRGEPLDDRIMSWTMTYRVLDGDAVVAESEVTSPWRCVSVDEVEAEVAGHGLSLTRHEDAVVIRR